MRIALGDRERGGLLEIRPPKYYFVTPYCYQELPRALPVAIRYAPSAAIPKRTARLACVVDAPALHVCARARRVHERLTLGMVWIEERASRSWFARSGSLVILTAACCVDGQLGHREQARHAIHLHFPYQGTDDASAARALDVVVEVEVTVVVGGAVVVVTVSVASTGVIAPPGPHGQ